MQALKKFELELVFVSVF